MADNNDKKFDVLIIIADFILRSGYASLINPPGGYWQDSNENHTAGKAILATTIPNLFHDYILSCIITIITSFLVIILPLTPLRSMHGLYMLLLLLLMWCSIASLSTIGIHVIIAITPTKELPKLYNRVQILIWTWIIVTGAPFWSNLLSTIYKSLKDEGRVEPPEQEIELV
uniref:PGG domain-containing protein n=1 Tax=Davidia involucrata TaxID=16924 RepID=A0A5B7ATC0_DAVIN